jgi:hypothetical protein
MNHYQAIILALDNLGGEGTIKEVSNWTKLSILIRGKMLEQL